MREGISERQCNSPFLLEGSPNANDANQIAHRTSIDIIMSHQVNLIYKTFNLNNILSLLLSI